MARFGKPLDVNRDAILETSVPGVFAARDVRVLGGAMNRVASAAGEGSIVVPYADEYLALT